MTKTTYKTLAWKLEGGEKIFKETDIEGRIILI